MKIVVLGPACLDLSRVTAADVPEDHRVDGPVAPLRHPDHRPGQWLLFQLPKSKTADLKKIASPVDGSYWVSSHDAYMAYIWRVLSKHRVKLFKPDSTQNLLWGEAIDMRWRSHNLPVPQRIQGNVVFCGNEHTESRSRAHCGGGHLRSPAVKAGLVGQFSLSFFSSYSMKTSRHVCMYTMTPANQINPPFKVHPRHHAGDPGHDALRHKTTLSLRTDSFPPMTNFTTEWRDTRPCDADFGFAFQHRHRGPDGGLSGAHQWGPPGNDEGNEFSISFEKELAQSLMEDPEWNQYFEFRGVDAGLAE